MRNRKLTILHILGDYKFYIDVANVFKEFDLYENIYLYKSRSTKTEEYKKFKNKTNNVVLTIKNQDIINLIRSKDIDIIYLHGLDISNCPLVSSIPREKNNIWWS